MNMKIKGPAIKFGNNIDTDVILPGKYLILVDPYELAKHALESLDTRFSRKSQKRRNNSGRQKLWMRLKPRTSPLSTEICRRKMRVSRIVRTDFLQKRHKHRVTSNRMQRHIQRQLKQAMN